MKTNVKAMKEDDQTLRQWLSPDYEPELVSIIVPTFNRSRLTIELLENLSKQVWNSLEFIIVDDGSTDDTEACVNSWKASHTKSKTLYIKQENAGPASARNAGLRCVKGEFIYFIDSDDLVFPDALSSMISAIRNSKTPYCVAGIYPADIDGVANTKTRKYFPVLNPKEIFANTWLTHGGFFHRSVLLAAGPYNTHLRLGEDSELHWRIVTVAGQPIVMNWAVGLRREHNLGHLAYGSTESQSYESSIAAMESFIEWAKLNGRHTKIVSKGLLISGTVLAIKLGRDSKWDLRDRALKLIADSCKHYPILGAIIGSVLQPRFQPLFIGLRYTLVIGKKIRDRIIRRRS
jgi:glycosyltransferase involved in cell wall biosynthesis